MLKLEKGTVLGTCKCLDCGAKTAWKVSASGLVYYQCLSMDENYSPCKSHMRRSGAKSQKMIAAYHEKRMEGALNEDKPDTAASIDPPPQVNPAIENKPVQGDGGLFGG